MLLPTDNTAWRRDLDHWFERNNVHPQILGEFEDYALLRAFAQSGSALFPILSVFAADMRKQDRIRKIGSTSGVELRFYAISAERKIKHPAVVAICESARKQFFA